MKIAIFARDPRVFGGGERYAIAVASELMRNGNEVKMYYYVKGQELRINTSELKQILKVDAASFSALKIGGERLFITPSAVRSLLEIKNFDVVYGTNSGVTINFFLTTFCKLFKKPYILKITDMSLFSPSKFKKYPEMKIDTFGMIRHHVINNIGAIQVPNRDMEELLKKEGYRGNVYQIPNFVDRTKPQKIICNKNKFIVLYVGRLSSYVKGLDMLENIVEMVMLKNKKILFHFVGSKGDGEERIRNLLKKYPKNIKWSNFLYDADLDNAYSQSNLFVFASRHETFGQSLLEAQQNGLPAIAFKVGGPSEIIKSKIQGRLIEPFDTKAFSQAILENFVQWESNKSKYEIRKHKISRITYARYGKKVIVPKIMKMFENR